MWKIEAQVVEPILKVPHVQEALAILVNGSEDLEKIVFVLSLVVAKIVNALFDDGVMDEQIVDLVSVGLSYELLRRSIRLSSRCFGSTSCPSPYSPTCHSLFDGKTGLRTKGIQETGSSEACT